MTNVVEHAGATQVRISHHRDVKEGRVEVTIRGVGFDERAVCTDAFGMLGMRERASLDVGGAMQIRSTPRARDEICTSASHGKGG